MRASEKEIICREYCCTHWAAWYGYPYDRPSTLYKRRIELEVWRWYNSLIIHLLFVCIQSVLVWHLYTASQKALSLSDSSLVVIWLNSLSVSLPPFEDSTSLRSSFVGARWLAALHVDYLLDYAIKFRVQDPIRLQAAPVGYNSFDTRVPCLLPILPLLKECNDSAGGEELIGEVSFIF